MRERLYKAGITSALELCNEFVDTEEFATVGNSFFDKSYFGTRILILASRAGDEIAVAGNMILNFTAAKAEIFIAYSEVKTWTAELSAAMKILGVPRDKVLFCAKDNLREIILNLRANIIFYAVDDKKLAAKFEKILNEILRSQPDYRPEVYQRFALATAVNSFPDFYAPNFLSTRRPKVGVTDGYDFDIIDRANYAWKNRVRFPVSESCRKTLLKDNPLANAIFAYKSRRKEFSPLKILNADEIFFERRTDNQIYLGKREEGRGNVYDKKISSLIPNPFSLKFDEAAQVQRIAIYGNIFDEEPAEIILCLEFDNFELAIDKESISIDNTNKIKMKLPARGLPCVRDVPKVFVRRAEIIPVNVGKNFSVSAVEFFANADPLKKISPFIKLCIGEDFFYNYSVPYEVEKIPLSLYRFHVDEPVKISAEADGENILTGFLTGDEELILNLGDRKEVILTAEVTSNANIYDRAIIRRVSDLTQIQLKILQWIDKFNGK